MCLWFGTQKAPGHEPVPVVTVLPRKHKAQAVMGVGVEPSSFLLRCFFQADLGFCKGV